MEQWMNTINGHQSNIREFGAASPNLYKSQAQITQFSKTGVPIREYSFDGMFPTNVSAIEMSWETVDTIEEFQVTFQYDYWTVSGATGNAGT